MKVRKAYRFRVYPTPEQVMLLSMTIGCCCLVDNLALEQRRLFSRKGRSLNYNTGANELPALKKSFRFSLRRRASACSRPCAIWKMHISAFSRSRQAILSPGGGSCTRVAGFRKGSPSNGIA